ncbi:MAG: UDP-3-O-(3-hydroxymyristoyl)glucosamine N-acyltransferase [Legionella sp.]|nr:UDP-3-O-(3-hydroxymyristoyl)glucosamine N-acyltransferase [Legionella sp.]
MFTLAQLAKKLNGMLCGNAEHVITSYASLSRAQLPDVSYYESHLPHILLQQTKAGVVLLKESHALQCQQNYIVVESPQKAIEHLISLLPQPLPEPSRGISASARIHSTALVSDDAVIGDHVLIGPGVKLASGVTIGAHTVIEAHVTIGELTQIASHVTIHPHCQIGANVLINSGCVLGASPFNYAKQRGQWLQEPVVGGVIIADKVHIGANSVIDRGTLNDTYIGEGVVIDNLVQIAHDVIIGPHTSIAGCAAIAAFASIGADCIIGGASTIAAHVHINENIVITGTTPVVKSLKKPGIYSAGILVDEHNRWRKNASRFNRLDDYISRLKKLEQDFTK